MNSIANIVIGSGPAAISAAKALVARGCDVTVVDPGRRLDPLNLQVKNRMVASEPEGWDPEDVRFIKQGMKATTKGVKVKLSHGSDYVYRGIDVGSVLRCVKSKALRSFASGGFSNVWGAGIQPYSEDALRDWPIGLGELAPHYRAVLGFVPNAWSGDDPDAELRDYSSFGQDLRPSRQAHELLTDLDRRRTDLKKAGLRFSRAQLAVRATDGDQTKGCRYCGMCLYGCPYDLIYSSDYTLQRLKQDGHIRHLTGYVVQRLEEEGSHVRVHAVNVDTRQEERFSAGRVFLGAGILETARIMLESTQLFDREIEMKHSDKFVLPFLRYRRSKGIAQDRLHTLSQVFMEVHDTDVAEHAVHLHWYTYNDLFRSALNRKAGVLEPLLRLPIRHLLERLLIVFGYVHSNDSAQMTIRLRRGTPNELVVRGCPQPSARRVANRIKRKLRANRRLLRGFAIWPNLGIPGEGNHSGGTFPMRERAAESATDIYGRVSTLERVHIVDASVMPSIAAGTITLTAMANAHRIASECDL